jgi:outer membrane protein W
VLQAGFDYDVSARTVFTAEFRAARVATDLEAGGERVATIRLHPSVFAVGIGFRF